MLKRPLRIAILALSGCAAAGGALSVGFGYPPAGVTFGQALDLAVPVRLEAGESLAPGCVHAEIAIGEHRLPQAALHVQVERGAAAADIARVRIRSDVVVREPVVAVHLSLGCSGPAARQFTVFADPPARLARAETPPAGSASTEPAATATVRRAAPVRAVATAVDAAALVTPRSRLEEPDERLQAARLAVAAHGAELALASQAAGVAQAAATAAEQRVVTLEHNLRTVEEGAVQQRAALAQLRQRLARADEQDAKSWALAALALALGGCTLWLGMRLRTLQRARGYSGQEAGQHAETAALPAAAMPHPAAAHADHPAAPDASAAAGPTATAPPAPVGAEVLPPQAWAEEALTRPISADDLIDMEQQADFFLVLGEEDSAIELLMSHLRSSGGTSPLPYLKLLEIFRRRGDREAYERMRKRFNDRFNAVAPDWDTDLDRGCDLQGHAPVVAALQAAWPAPLDAMAELENLLFRKRNGELFDLPAYRDVLMLYAVARDLHRRADRQMDDVDVLLPLTHGSDGAMTEPHSIFDRSGHGELQPVRSEDRPTAPIDLDLDLDTPAPAATSKKVVVALRRVR